LERQDAFEEAGVHFESRYFLTFVWLPPAEDASRIEGFLYEGRAQNGVDPWELLRGFVDRTNRVLQLVEGFMPECAWLDDQETLTYLHSTVSTKRHRVRVPEIRRQWFAKRKSVAAILKEVMTNEAPALLDTDAHNKAMDADAALQELGSDVIGQAYITATVTVWDN